MMNKKGASLSGWSEAAIFLTMFVILAGIVIINMNTTYDKDFDSTFGISTNQTQHDLIDYQDTLKEGVEKGEQEGSGLGLSLSTVWLMIKSGISITFTFLTGQWIPNLIGYLGMGNAGVVLATFLQILFVISVGFIAIKLFMRIKP